MGHFTNRRNFLKSGLLASGAVSILPLSELVKSQEKQTICIFSKHLQWLDYQDMAKTAKEIGFDGIDLTVRPKGHVLPEEASKNLPKAAEAIFKQDLKLPMISTAISDADNPTSKEILKTAADLGISFYRMNWFKYDQGLSIQKNHEQFLYKLRKLADLNQQYGIKGAYQNHAGAWWFGASIWDIRSMLYQIDSEWLGLQYDIRHGMVEGGQSWVQDLKYIAPFINTLDFKDFQWVKKEDWSLENVPLGEGMVDFQQYVGYLNQWNINAPISIHYEYPLGGAEHGHRELHMPVQEVKHTMQKDLRFVKNLFT